MPYIDSGNSTFTTCDGGGHGIHNEKCWRYHLPCATHRIEVLQIENQQLHDDCEGAASKLKVLLRERDEAREWARDLLARCELEHWVTLRIGSYSKEDEATIAALQAERDRLYQALKDH